LENFPTLSRTLGHLACEVGGVTAGEGCIFKHVGRLPLWAARRVCEVLFACGGVGAHQGVDIGVALGAVVNDDPVT
jgi:hypothetical protein